MAKPVLGVLCGGGPAPGMNCVVSSVAIAALKRGWEVLGFYDGFKWLMAGRTDKYVKLTFDEDCPVNLEKIHLRGGTVLRTSRANPTKKEEDMKRAVASLKQLNVKYMVTIGGDDTCSSAMKLAASSNEAFSVAHVPKTIDNDLPLPAGVPTFGFESARDLGATIIDGLMNDCESSPRFYIIIAMGREAGHLALGIGKSSGAQLTLIPEEFDCKVSFDRVCDIIEGSVIKRQAMGKPYGVVVLAEGLVEYMDDASKVKAAGDHNVPTDAHGHLRLEEVEFGLAVRDELRRRCQERGKPTTFITKNLGYELRSADPNPFDIAYTRDLGFGAVEYLANGGTHAMITVDAGELQPLPFDAFMDPVTKRSKTRLVDVAGRDFRVAKTYMDRLGKDDFEEPGLSAVAETAGLEKDVFVQRFGSVL